MAIPSDRHEFLVDEARGTSFLREYRAAVRRAGGSLWSQYEPYAAVCRATMKDAASFGVTVVSRATLAAFCDAITEASVVTLVAHSCGPEIAPEDIHDVDVVAATSSEIAHALSATTAIPASWTADSAADWLNALLGPAESDDVAESETAAQAHRTADYRNRWERRRKIEHLCGAALTGGPAIEFFDGLRSIDDIDAAVPLSIKTIDLTVCDSVLLAECLRRRRTTGVILANPRPTTLDFRLVLYQETIRFMARHRTTYPDAVIRLRRSLRRHA